MWRSNSKKLKDDSHKEHMTGQQFAAQNNSHKDQSLTQAKIYRRRVYQLVHKMEVQSVD
jgi:hypothetical protein